MTVAMTNAPQSAARARVKKFLAKGTRPRRTALLAGFGSGLLAAMPASAQLGIGDMFSDDLAGATPDVAFGFHDERFAPNTNSASADRTVLTQFGLSGFAVPSAPPGDPLNDESLLVFVNTVDNLPGDGPERVAVNVSPDLTLNGATQDWVMTVNAYANTSGATGSTLAFQAGMYSNTSRVNWQGGTDTDGLFWSLTTDGRANNDLLSFQGTATAPPTAFQVQTIDGVAADVDFAEGLYADRWVTLAVGSHDNTPFFAVRTHEADGFPNEWQVLESFDNTGGPTVGRAWFGVEDPFNSADSQAGVAFRNASISTLTPGDTDLDGDVDFSDAMRLVNSYSGDGTAADTGAPVAPGFDADLWLWTAGDFDQDRDVDFADALALIANYDGAATSISPPGDPTAGLPASLIVDVVSGAMSIESQDPLSGLAIEGENLSGSEAGLPLALAATDSSYVAISIDGGFDGGSLGLETSGVTDPSAWSFTYGVGGESVEGTVVFVPEPAIAAFFAVGLGAFLRRRSA